ncbi:MAG: hypothetical protein AVDCRST_MAG89-2463, partial [uncultured Gemmatimonadetes bacterium]
DWLLDAWRAARAAGAVRLPVL